MPARVIPPLTGASPTITAAMLTATNVPEAPPAAYNGGTTYGLDAEVSVAWANNSFDVYRSLQAGNTGHTPATSPTWWRFMGSTYGVYAAGTYALNDRVIDTTAHLEYLSLVGSNTAALSDETKWALQGPTNRWRAFDVLRGTGTVGPSGVSFTVTPGERVDAVALAGLVADSFSISLTVDGVEKWAYTEDLSSRETLTWSDYFFGAFSYRSVSAVFDIPKYSGAELTITFERASGDVTVGAIWVGNAVSLGELETEPTLDRRNFSTIDRAFDGSAILIQRRTVPKHSWITRPKKSQLKKITPLVDLLNAVPAVWVGLDDTADEYFEPLVLVAIYTRFTITPGHPDPRIDLDLEET